MDPVLLELIYITALCGSIFLFLVIFIVYIQPMLSVNADVIDSKIVKALDEHSSEPFSRAAFSSIIDKGKTNADLTDAKILRALSLHPDEEFAWQKPPPVRVVPRDSTGKFRRKTSAEKELSKLAADVNTDIVDAKILSALSWEDKQPFIWSPEEVGVKQRPVAKKQKKSKKTKRASVKKRDPSREKIRRLSGQHYVVHMEEKVLTPQDEERIADRKDRLDKIYRLWRKYGSDIGLGMGIAGSTGTFTCGCNSALFEVLPNRANACFVDIGAGDGVVSLCASAIGYYQSYGIEIQDSVALRQKFLQLKQDAEEEQCRANDSRYKSFNVQVDFGTDATHFKWEKQLPRFDAMGFPIQIHTYAAWEGFSEDDQYLLLAQLNEIVRPDFAVFIASSRKPMGRPECILPYMQGYSCVKLMEMRMVGSQQQLRAVVLRNDRKEQHTNTTSHRRSARVSR